MSKVKCKVCGNEVSGICSIKKDSVKPNKPRICDAYVYDEHKVRNVAPTKTTRISYTEQQRAKKEFKRKIKEELAKAKAILNQKPGQGTAMDLGLIARPGNVIVTPDDPEFYATTRNLKNPLTGNLSRFTTTATEE